MQPALETRDQCINQGSIAIIVGTKKADRVELNFCPFYGVNIETNYKEKPDDS